MDWCETCSGTGKISCGACWGGHHKAICPDCLGKGILDSKSCTRCHGTGKITPQSCPFCGNSIECPDCKQAWSNYILTVSTSYRYKILNIASTKQSTIINQKREIEAGNLNII